MFPKRSREMFVALMAVLTAGGILPGSAQTQMPANLTAAQIVEQMLHRSQLQGDGLKHYKAMRHYHVEYRGFSARLAADLDAEISYDSTLGKSFRIVKESGSKALCEKVLKRAVESEREAWQNKSSIALTPANYAFNLVGSESLDGHPAFVMNVEPLTKSKFLYRGKIWVDAADFALVKIEAEPARNPSFWITRTLIRQTFAKIGPFWLPVQNRSESKVRVGGTAVLIIDYGAYQIASDTLHAGTGF